MVTSRCRFLLFVAIFAFSIRSTLLTEPVRSEVLRSARAMRKLHGSSDAGLFLRRLAIALGERPQPQRVELDEAAGVVVVVGDGAFLEGDEVLVVERIGAVAADQDHIALVEF